MSKFIFVIGGVMSGVGKGTTTAALGRLLLSKGYRVTAVKIDPYVNIDAGTMNPTEHGEVFVTEDGDETDQDIGSYERFLDTNILSTNYMTTGRVYQSVIERERTLGYGGRCVEVVPDVPNEVIRRLKAAAQKSKADIVLVEVGGTAGEYQNILFLEAARMMKLANPSDVLFVLVSYLPVPHRLGEMKTKPTQYAARTLNAAGIQADFVVARSEYALDEPRRAKMSVLCGVAPEDIIPSPDLPSVYEAPIHYDEEHFGERVLKKLKLRVRRPNLGAWKAMIKRMQTATKPLRIGIVGKYFSTGNFVLSDVYFSVIEALKHAIGQAGMKPELVWLNSEEYEKNPGKVKELLKFDGVLIPGGFGTRGVEGKIRAIEFVREHRIAYFGLCYGMQLAAVEFARNVCGLKKANTTEVDQKTPHPVIAILPEQEQFTKQLRYGGTMRLGAYPCALKKGSVAERAYGERLIMERHRHRYELNNAYREEFEKRGMIASGTSPDGRLVEIVEIPKHPFFVGVQFHPEFLSRPLRPHPLFRAFVKAAARRRGK